MLIQAKDAFTLYHKGSQSDASPHSTALPVLGHALAGSTGTAISNLCTYPLELIITRFQIQRQLRKDRCTPSEAEYKGLGDAVQQIYKNEGGLAGFYIGVFADTGETMADSFLFFFGFKFIWFRR